MKKAPDQIDIHVGSRVRLRRVLMGLSQEKLGTALGVTFQQVQKYEKGMNRIGAGRLQQAAKMLGVPVSFFFEGAPDKGGANGGFADGDQGVYLADFATTSEGSQLINAFLRIKDARVRKRVIDLVIAMAASSDDS
jgi:transcriptional regulator with XRE-family HTH domain